MKGPVLRAGSFFGQDGNMKPKFRLYKDALDTRLVSAVNHDGVVRLAELPRKHPELAGVRYNLLWYRIRTLADAGLIQVKKERRNLICYGVDG